LLKKRKDQQQVPYNWLGNTAYLNGISANMDKLEISDTNKAAYLADSSINLGMAGLHLKI
jgi:hypothetical protein